MKISIEHMSERDFDLFSKDCIEDFANQLTKFRNLDRAEAYIEAKKSFQKSLPEGFRTKDMSPKLFRY